MKEENCIIINVSSVDFIAVCENEGRKHFFTEDVSEKDRHLIKEGTVFAWRRGLEDSPAGQRKQISELIFEFVNGS